MMRLEYKIEFSIEIALNRSRYNVNFL